MSSPADITGNQGDPPDQPTDLNGYRIAQAAAKCPGPAALWPCVLEFGHAGDHEDREHTQAPPQCQCRAYHYLCADCGQDCTAGSDAGPATQAVDGKTRCYACNQKHSEARARLYNAADELLSILKVARPLLADVTQHRGGALRRALIARIDAALEEVK